MRYNSLKNKGFTLLEILVALAILAIAFMAIIKATGLSTKQTAQVKERLLAHWVLGDIWKQVQLGIIVCPQEKTYTLFQENYLWKCEPQETKNKKILQLNIYIYKADKELAQMSYYTITHLDTESKS